MSGLDTGDFSRGGEQEVFDAFLCHNLRDKYFVRHLANRLKSAGYNVWLDEAMLRAGGNLLEQINSGIDQSDTAIVVVGGNGFGQYQRSQEVERLKSGHKLLPILAPGANHADAADIEAAFPDLQYVDLSNHTAGHIPEDKFQYITRALGKPRAVRPSTTTEPMKPAQVHARDLAKRVSEGSLVVFLGNTWREHFDNDPHPDQEQLATYLLRKAMGSPLEEQLPDFVNPSLEEAARIFELRNSTKDLFDAAIGGYVMPRTVRPSARFNYIAETLGTITRLRANTARRQGKTIEPVVVFSTQVDLRFERSLIASGVPFVRCVVMPGDAPMKTSAYCSVQTFTSGGFELGSIDKAVRQFIPHETRSSAPSEMLRFQRDSIISFLKSQDAPESHYPTLEDVDQMVQIGEILQSPIFTIPPELYARSWDSRLPGLVIVKLMGASGVKDSFAITSGQVLALTAFAESMPDVLQSILKNQPRVFFGFSPAETLFQTLHFAFLRRAGPNKTIAVLGDFGQTNDLRGYLERIVGQENIDIGLQNYMGMNAILEPAQEFAQMFIKQLSEFLTPKSAFVGGDVWY